MSELCSLGGHVIIAFPSGQREQKDWPKRLVLGAPGNGLARLTVQHTNSIHWHAGCRREASRDGSRAGRNVCMAAVQ